MTVKDHVIAGVILLYARASQIGDRVKIADATGAVLEKTLLLKMVAPS